MARKAASPVAGASRPPRKRARKRTARKESARASGSSATLASTSPERMVEMARMAKLLTPEQAIELYKANAKMALDVINAAIDGTARMRKLQFEGEETAREFGRRTARGAAEAKDPQSLVAVGQEAGREAIEKSLAYWGEMFDLIVEMQKRLFSLIEDQAEGLPGVKEAKAAMAMMPDLAPMRNVVNAMQGVVGSGAGALTSMQKVMSDMAKMAQSTMPGAKR